MNYIWCKCLFVSFHITEKYIDTTGKVQVVNLMKHGSLIVRHNDTCDDFVPM